MGKFTVLDACRIITTPSCWLRNAKTCNIWDCRLNQLMDMYELKLVDDHEVKLGSTSIWVSNWPYAFGSNYSSNRIVCEPLPSRTTCFRLKDLIEGRNK